MPISHRLFILVWDSEVCPTLLETPFVDNTLRFFDNCPKYVQEVAENKEVHSGRAATH